MADIRPIGQTLATEITDQQERVAQEQIIQETLAQVMEEDRIETVEESIEIADEQLTEEQEVLEDGQIITGQTFTAPIMVDDGQRITFDNNMITTDGTGFTIGTGAQTSYTIGTSSTTFDNLYTGAAPSINKLSLVLISRDLETFLQEEQFSLESLKPEEQEIIDVVSEVEGSWIAGGALLDILCGRVEQIKDWDIFFDSEEAYDEVMVQIESRGFAESAESPWGISFKKGSTIAQLAGFKFFATPMEIFDSFDFTICCFATDGDLFYYTQRSIQHLKEGRFDFIYTEDPARCLKRMVKYSNKGFKITKNCANRFFQFIKYNASLEDPANDDDDKEIVGDS